MADMIRRRRFVFIVLAIVFTYFVAWQATIDCGVPDMSPRRISTDLVVDPAPLQAGSPAPFIVWKDQFEVITGHDNRFGLVIRTKYKFWIFGFESDIYTSDGKPIPKIRE